MKGTNLIVLYGAKILEALIERNIERAQNLMEEHMLNTKRYILSDFKE